MIIFDRPVGQIKKGIRNFMPKVVNKHQKQEHILRAALTVFAQKGFNATKMTDIALQAGIGKGTLYEYFNSKEDLFLKTFFFLFEQYDQELQEKLNVLTNPKDKIKLLIQVYFLEFGQQNFDFMQIMMDYWMASARQNAVQNFSLLALYQEYQQVISQILQEGIEQNIFRTHNTCHYAQILIALLDGLFLQIFLDPKAFDLKAMADDICEMFLASLMLNKETQ